MISFRKTTPDDLVPIKFWISQDPDHKGMPEEFWASAEPGVSCYVIEDQKGPVMFVRQEVEGQNTRLHVQFAPSHRKRIVKALEQGYPLVAADAKRRGFKNILFESGSIALVRVMFAMGFRAELVAEL